MADTTEENHLCHRDEMRAQLMESSRERSNVFALLSNVKTDVIRKKGILACCGEINYYGNC